MSENRAVRNGAENMRLADRLEPVQLGCPIFACGHHQIGVVDWTGTASRERTAQERKPLSDLRQSRPQMSRNLECAGKLGAV
jgi:hypothetical protein